MSFDGTDTDSFRIIQVVTEILGPSGERWAKLEYHNRRGNHCLPSDSTIVEKNSSATFDRFSFVQRS